jgi:hypothetical protein
MCHVRDAWNFLPRIVAWIRQQLAWVLYEIEELRRWLEGDDRTP